MARIDFNVDDTDRAITMLLRRILEATPKSGRIEVDLSACQFLGPSAVTTLGGLRRVFALRGITLALIPPHLARLEAYCRYSGLIEDFGLGPGPTAHPDNATSPIREIRGALPTAAVAEITALAKRLIPMSTVAESDLQVVLAELIQNVLDHAESPVGGVLSARAYAREREVRFAVADFGRGIRATLAPRHKIDTDSDAIRLALREGVTGNL